MFILLDEDELKVKLGDQILSMTELKKVVDVLDDGSKIIYALKELPMKAK